MSDYATKDDIKDLKGLINDSITKAVEDLSDVINALAQNMFSETTSIRKELGKKASQDSIDKLTNTIDAFVKRLDDNETEQIARDAQFERLLEWAREVSAKTGIPLKGL